MQECRNYLGSWSESDAKSECDTVFSGVSGTFGTDPCLDKDAIGTCTGPMENGQWTKVWFYGGDPNITENMCFDFFKGTWDKLSGQGLISDSYEATKEAVASLSSSADVEVTPNCSDAACLLSLVKAHQGIVFSPRDGAEATFILYPGGLVDPRAYAPVAHAIAKYGVRVVLVPMPDDLALNGSDRARDIMAATVEPTRWFLGGHSMGGAMAAHFLHEVPDSGVKGLVLWAAYAEGKDDLSASSLPVLSLQASRDGISTSADIENHKPFLPLKTQFLTIEGGNHAQFGMYGNQDGDQPAQVTASEQRDQIAGATVHFIASTIHGAEPRHPAFANLPPDQTQWCARLQGVVANLTDPLSDQEMSVESHIDFQTFGTAMPAIEEGSLALHGRVSKRGNGTLRNGPPMLGGEVWCKVKTQDAVTTKLGRVAAGEAGTCADMNRETLAWARAQLPASQRAVLDNRVVQFLDDIEYDTGIAWLGSEGVVLSSLSNTNFSLASARMLVGDRQDLPEAARQVMYCKLWAPEAALHWALEQTQDMVDAPPADSDAGGCSVSSRPANRWVVPMCLLLTAGALARRRRRVGNRRVNWFGLRHNAYQK